MDICLNSSDDKHIRVVIELSYIRFLDKFACALCELDSTGVDLYIWNDYLCCAAHFTEDSGETWMACLFMDKCVRASQPLPFPVQSTHTHTHTEEITNSHRHHTSAAILQIYCPLTIFGDFHQNNKLKINSPASEFQSARASTNTHVSFDPPTPFSISCPLSASSRRQTALFSIFYSRHRVILDVFVIKLLH